MTKAEAACMTCPSDMVPLRNLGEERITGITGATRKLVCATDVVRMYCRMISRQRAITRLSDLVSSLLSSSSPAINAMLSPFSRRRVSP
jgi:hypothetical protein